MTYSKVRIALHWLSAVIILWATFSGFYVALFDVSDTIKQVVGFFNVSITTLFIPFFIVRFYLAFTQRISMPGTLSQWAALVVHKFIYLVTGFVLVTGVLMMDKPINVFHLLLIPQPLADTELIALFKVLHIDACIVLAALVGLHIVAVFKHQLSGTPILKRMSW